MRRHRQSRTRHDQSTASGYILVDRTRLIRRWRYGSDAFFWRAAADGLLLPVRRGRSVLVADVFDFEGGQPPEGRDAACRVDLMLPEEVGAQVSCGRDWVLDRCKSGALSPAPPRILPERKIRRFRPVRDPRAHLLARIKAGEVWPANAARDVRS